MWTYHLPTKVTFGPESALLAEEFAQHYFRRPLLVTDQVLAGLPAVRRILERFHNAPVFADVEPNPTVANVDALAQLIRDAGADVVVAIGGGSVMDCAKAGACLARTADKSIRPYHSEGRALEEPGPPVIAVPTTAGTGSEVTPFAVLDDREKGIKGPIATDLFYPVLALVDPLLSHSMPPGVTAATGLDALTHAIEGYWSRNHQPLCDLMAIEAARLIFAHLAQTIEHPEHSGARAGMAQAALLAGMAFQRPKNAMVHACSYPLSKRYHLSHGAACAFTLEGAIRLNTPHMDGRMEAFARACGFDAVETLVARIRELKRLGGLPCTLADAGIDPKDVPDVIADSFHPLMNNNPKPVAPEDLEALYSALE